MILNKKIALAFALIILSVEGHASSITATMDNGATITTSVDQTARTITYAWDLSALDGDYEKVAILQSEFPRGAYCDGYRCVTGDQLTGAVISKGDGQGDQPLRLEYEGGAAPPRSNSVIVQYSASYEFTGFVDGPPDENVTVSCREPVGGEVELWAYTPAMRLKVKPDAVSILHYPRGEINTATPTYTFESVEGATWYYLWVNDATGNVIRKWYTTDQAHCVPSGGCRIFTFHDDTRMPIAITGNATWWIQTWNPNGYSNWSSAVEFRL